MYWKEKSASLSLPDDEYLIAIGESLFLVPRLMCEATAEMRALADRLDREQTGSPVTAAVEQLRRIAGALDSYTAKAVHHDGGPDRVAEFGLEQPVDAA